MSLVRRALLLLTLCSISAEAQRVTGPRPAASIPIPVTLDATGKFIEKLVLVGDDLYIAGQPTAAALKELRELGVTTIVNLRTPEEMQGVRFDEAATAASLGMRYITLPMRGTREFPYAPAALDSFAAVVARSDGKVLLHCTVAWRTSHLWMAYLVSRKGMSVETAITHARAINLMEGMRHSEGREPVEEFLGRDIPELRRRP